MVWYTQSNITVCCATSSYTYLSVTFVNLRTCNSIFIFACVVIILFTCNTCLVNHGACHVIFCSWYFGDVARAEAEKWLLIPGNPSGTFLVRTSSSQKNSLSLSLRDGEGIKHYRIRRLDDGGYFIASRRTFQTLRVRWNLWRGLGGF